MMRLFLLTCGLARLLMSQPAFEVATVKPNPNPEGPRLFQALPGGRVNLANQTVREILYSAYQTQDFRIVGGPVWLAEDRFDVEAKAPNDAAPPQMLLMLRTLLADRFRLRMHTEMREVPVYRMVLARRDGKTGPNLKPSTCSATANPNDPQGQTPCINRGGPGSIVSTGATMDTLANRLGRLPQIARPIINETGLKGSFDLELNFAADPNSAEGDMLSIFTALQEQLGIKLEPGRAPIEVQVIDNAERPSQN